MNVKTCEHVWWHPVLLKRQPSPIACRKCGQKGRLDEKHGLIPEGEMNAKIWKSFLSLTNQLSPENLNCDGEISAAEANAKYRKLTKQWEALEATVGRKVSESEVYDRYMLHGDRMAPVDQDKRQEAINNVCNSLSTAVGEASLHCSNEDIQAMQRAYVSIKMLLNANKL